MPQINQTLIQKLMDKLGIKRARIYQLIQASQTQNRVPRNLAALLVAGDNGLSMEKYGSAEEIFQLRGIHSHVAVTQTSPPAAIPARAASIRKNKGKRIPKTKENTVFVVHGRDSKACDAMYQFLGSLGLQPQEWGHAIRSVSGKGGNPYVNDAVTKIMEQAEAIVVLLTPDDDVKLKQQFLAADELDTEGKSRSQARPNVIFETGIAIGAYHSKTVIVQVGDVKPFTDIGGMHIHRMSNSAPSRNELSRRLTQCGCTINTDGDHWLRAGDFVPTPPGDGPSRPKKLRKKKR